MDKGGARLSPLVAEWLKAEGIEPPSIEWWKKAAEHQKWVFEHLRQTVAQAITVHSALQIAELQEEADRFALDKLVPYFSRVGMYQTLLDKWLLPMRESGEESLQDKVLNWLGTTYLAIGDYDAALDYLLKSLSIAEEIGDQAGFCVTLFNMGHIYWTKNDKQQAVAHWVSVYKIAKRINEAQVLSALENLAKQFGGEGLEFWENLEQRASTG